MSYLTDMLGSTVALANSSGTIATQYGYEPYGATTITGSSTNPFQFTGRENDGTGLYYYRARYYSPAFQRFISQDPLGFGGGDANLYGYVFNDPIRYIDPWGLLTFRVFGQTVDADLSVTLANIVISWNIEGFSLKDVSVNVQQGLSLGAGVDVSIDRPCQPYVAPYVGLGKNFSVGTNLVDNPKTKSLSLIPRGFNFSYGPSVGLPFGVNLPLPNWHL